MEAQNLVASGILAVLAVLLCRKWWRRSHVVVNCWFCNLNCSVPVSMSNKWICQHCDQYNGFQQDGDYNCEIKAQSDAALNKMKDYCSVPKNNFPAFDNGLCSECNHNQEKKIALLASFQPINLNNYDLEIDHFRENLERAYRLCSDCEFVLEEALSKKKTLVLASNLNMSGLKASRVKQNNLKKGAVNLASILTTVLAATVAFSSTVSLYSSTFMPFESKNNATSLLSVSFSHHSLNIPVFLPFLASCPVPTSHASSTGNLPEAQESDPELGTFKSYILPVAATLLFFQFMLMCYTACSWFQVLMGLIQVSILLPQHLKYYVSSYFVGIQVLVSWVILLYSLSGAHNRRSRQAVPLKRLRNVPVKPPLTEARVSKRLDEEFNTQTLIEAPRPFPLNSSCKPSPLLPVHVDLTPTPLPNYLTLPTRSAPRQDSPPPNISAETPPLPLSSRLSNSPHSLSFEQQSIASQEDARSDASVDSAFSNADSVILDSADMVGSAIDFDKERTQDVEVQSLINSLSLGACQRNQTKGHAFTTKRYGRNKKAHSLLKPSKLDEAFHGSLWHDKGESVRERRNGTASAFVSMCNQSAKIRSISPTGSIHSQSTQSTLPPEPTIVSTISRPWNGPSILQNGLSVALPSQSPYSTFGSHALFSSPHVPHIVYTSYGLNQQPFSPIWNPSAFSVPQQTSYLFGNSSTQKYRDMPPSKKFSSFRHPDEFERESDEDVDVSSFSQSSYSKHPNANLSSSFVESVWQSRSVIIYTTTCYAVLGSVIYAYYQKDWIAELLSSVQLF